jgi:hypothetical protein
VVLRPKAPMSYGTPTRIALSSEATLEGSVYPTDLASCDRSTIAVPATPYRRST